MPKKFTHKLKPLDWFRSHPDNPRSHPPQQIEHLTESLRRFGAYRNVVALADGTLLAGHGVVQAAKEAGLEKLPVHIFAGSAKDARRLLLADNALAQMAQDDLSAVLGLAEEQESELVGTGIDEGYLETLRAIAASEAWLEEHGGADVPDMPGWEEPETKLSVTIRCRSEEDRSQVAGLLGLELVAKRVRYHFAETNLEA